VGAVYEHLFGAWPMIVVAAIVLAAPVVVLPRAIVALMAWTEALGAWSCERIRQVDRRLRERRIARRLNEATAQSPTGSA
jgi:hypothetical protein